MQRPGCEPESLLATQRRPVAKKKNYVPAVCGSPHVMSRLFCAWILLFCRASATHAAYAAAWPTGRRTNKQRPRSLTHTPPAWHAVGRACARDGMQTVDHRRTDRQTGARTDSQTHAQPSTLPCFFFCAAAAGPVCFRHALSLCPPPPPLSAQAGGSHPCVVWSLQHCLLRRWITWRWAALLPRPCIALVLISICAFPPCTCPKLTFRMAAVKVVRPLLSFLHLLAGWPACGSSIPAHTPQVWNAAPSAPEPCMWSSFPPPYGSSN